MRVLMAVSRDGFVAKNESDDMKWTGYTDKALFRLLTTVGNHPLGVGSKTFALMPKLPGRPLVPLSQDPEKGVSLDKFWKNYPGAWLIGGQTVVRQALMRGLVSEVVLCHSDVALGSGVPADWTMTGFRERCTDIRLDGVHVEVRR